MVHNSRGIKKASNECDSLTCSLHLLDIISIIHFDGTIYPWLVAEQFLVLFRRRSGWRKRSLVIQHTGSGCGVEVSNLFVSSHSP